MTGEYDEREERRLYELERDRDAAEDDLDEDGYPTEHALKRIEQWPVKSRGDCEALMSFVHSLWNYPEYFSRDADGTWHVSTVGWSGNESLIDAMGRNFIFWSLCWKQARRGGHYEFDLERFPKVCGKRCDHGSECLLVPGHDDGHETQHGCVFYDAEPKP